MHNQRHINQSSQLISTLLVNGIIKNSHGLYIIKLKDSLHIMRL